MELGYRSIKVDDPVRRTIEPVGLFHENNYWYVMGYCHLRQDYRQFRTDRIAKIRRTQTPFAMEHSTLEELRSQSEEAPTTRVRIMVDKTVARFIQSGKRHQGFVKEERKGDWVEMTFMATDIENGFSRWYLMFGDYAKILEPEALKKRVKQLLENMHEGIKD